MSFMKYILTLACVVTVAIGFAHTAQPQDEGTMRVYNDGHLVMNKQFHGEPLSIQLPAHHGKGPQTERIVIKDHGPHHRASETISYFDDAQAMPKQARASFQHMERREAQMDDAMLNNMNRMDHAMQQDMNQAFADFPQQATMQMPPAHVAPAPILHHAAAEAHQPVLPPHKGKRTFLEWLRGQFSS